MSCYTCDIVSRIAPGTWATIYFSTMFDYFAVEVATVLEDYGLGVRHEAPFFSVVTDNVGSLLSRLYHDERFSPVERNTISLVVLGKEDSFDETWKQFMRPLAQWYRLASATDLAEIIEERAIRVLFQPIIRLKERTVFGYECLSRGICRDGTIVSPGTLYAKAAEHSLLFNLDRLMRENALIEADRCGAEGHLCVNFIPKAIYDPELCFHTTMEAVEATAIDPSRIVFEVVDAESLDDMDLFKRIVAFCRSRGLKIALDDIGGSYPLLPSMARLRPDILKLDEGLVRNIDRDTKKQTRFATVRDLAREHEIALLAEGVETAGEMTFLTEHGVDLVQGFYFSEPREEAHYEVPAGR
ncbi:MAG: EAL domain-containing protein [Spirochaetales bacterium]|nr:EAL domain-containing protein [Spirochaetales bacterium]